MSNSLLVNCACCSKPVITKHKSKRRTCSHKCFMKLWRQDRKAVAENLAAAEAA